MSRDSRVFIVSITGILLIIASWIMKNGANSYIVCLMGSVVLLLLSLNLTDSKNNAARRNGYIGLVVFGICVLLNLYELISL